MRVLLAAWGSAGDVFPSIAVARELKVTGAEVVLATSQLIAPSVRAAGIRAVTIGAASDSEASRDGELLTLRFDGLASWRRLFDGYVSREVDASLKKLGDVLSQWKPDLVVVHPFAQVAAIAAEASGIPWLSMHLYPQLLGRCTRTTGCARFGGRFARELRRAERESGVKPRANPVIDWGVSPQGGYITHDPEIYRDDRLMSLGFPHWDAFDVDADSMRTLAHLSRERSAVLAFGSFVGAHARPLLSEVAYELGRAGVTTVVIDPSSEARSIAEGVEVLPYVPYSTAFGFATVVIHHGGIGTTYAAVNARRPSVIVPFAFDQAFNARTMHAMGVATRASRDVRVIVTQALETLKDSSVAGRVSAIADRLQPPHLVATQIAAGLLRWS